MSTSGGNMKVGKYKVQEITDGEITGRIENWSIDSDFVDGYTVVRGHVHDDVRGRWREGQYVRSSALVGDCFDHLKEGDIVRTLNSKYLLGKPKQKES
jgi:hypothetical protein